MVKKVVEEEFPEQGADRRSSPRRPTTTAPITSIPTRSRACSASSRSAPSRTRCATCAARSARQAAEQLRRRLVLQRPHDEEARARNEREQADRRRHRRRRLHRQPHGRPAARRAAIACASSTTWSAGARPISRTTPAIRTVAFEQRRHPRASARTTRSSPARDYVFHFAGIGDIVPSIERPLEYMSANVQGTVHMLECARARRRREVRLRRVVVVLRPGRDADARGSPDRAAVSLRAVASTRASRRRSTGTRSTGCRSTRSASSTPTARARARRAPMARCSACSCRQKLAGKPFTVVGDGTQTRDFLYVTDVAAAFLAAAETEHDRRDLEPRRRQSAVGQPAGRAARRRVVHIPKRPGEPDCTWADITQDHARARLGAQRSASRKASRASSTDIDYWRDAPLWDPEFDRARRPRRWFEHARPRESSMMDDASRKIVSHKIKTRRRSRRR